MLKRYALHIFIFPVLVTLVSLHVNALVSDPDKLTEFLKQHDLSSLLKPKSKFLGFVQPNYKRLKVFYSSVSRDEKDPAVYTVAGSTTIDSNTCEFKGTIHFSQYEDLPKSKMHYGVDNQLKNVGIKAEGHLRGRYEFNESEKKKNCGVFNGEMTVGWYVDKEGKIQYDDIERDGTDGYRNNQYRGSWKPFDGVKTVVANWGEYRIPGSGDLDIGAGEFSPDPKYSKQGWDDFPRQ